MSWAGRAPGAAQDLAAARKPVRPVAEPPGGIVRADDQAGPDDERCTGKDPLDLLLAQGLQSTVVRLAGGAFDLIGRNDRERSVLVERPPS